MLRCWAEVLERQLFEISVYIMLLYDFLSVLANQYCNTLQTYLTVPHSDVQYKYLALYQRPASTNV